LRVCYIMNPTAGNGRAKRLWEKLAPQAAARGEFAVYQTTAKGEAVQLARQAADRGFECVVAVGGDGTLSEVANGLFGTTARLGLIPAGTGNDFARAVGLFGHPTAALRHIYEGTPHSIDLVQIKGGPVFINVAGVGFDAEVARRVNAYPKFMGGTIPYLWGVLGTLLRYRPVPLEIELDGTSLHRSIFLTALGNAQAYGGGMRITPDAKVDDGWLDICIGAPITLAELGRLLPKIYQGAHVGHPKVEFHRARHVELRSSQGAVLHADGEVLGGLPLTVDLLPGAITFMGPAAAAGFAHNSNT
jgi:diacylglycerol kinase (ATP)